MICEIFIENNRLDIDEGLSNLLTYAIDDVKDVGSRNAHFSKTIVLPGTGNNNRLLGSLFDVKVSNSYNPAVANVGMNFNAAKQADCVIFQNHLQVFKGIIRVVEIVISDGIPEYECVVFGELTGLTNAIGRRRLNDLDFSAYDHVLSLSNVTGSWDSVNGTGFFYPLADYGGVSTNKIDFDLSTFRPALYVKEYIDKIFAQAGYTFESDIMDTSRFKSLVIPHNQKILQVNESELFRARKVSSTQVVASGGSDTGAITWPSAFTGNGFSINSGGASDEVTYNTAAATQGRMFFSIRGEYANEDTDIRVHLRQNGTPIFEIGQFDITPPDGNRYPYEFIIDCPVTPINQNDVFDVYVERNSGIGSGAFEVNAELSQWWFVTDIPVLSPVSLGGNVYMTDVIPKNILQKDFLSSIFKLFNLYVTDDKLKPKHLRITPFVDFYNASGVVDWTYKLDRSQVIRIKPMSELNNRYYDFKFKQDTDFYNEQYFKRYGESYGDYLFDSEFDFTNDRTPIDLIFSPTPLVGYGGRDKVAPAYFKLDSNDVETGTDVNIRILQAKKITGVTNWEIKLGAFSIGNPITVYGYAGHYDDPDAPANDIHFGVPRELFFTLLSGAINVTQFNVYWSSYMAEITDKDSKLLTAHFKLSHKDIYELDFSKLIHIDGSYFRLNKIEDWNATTPDVCKCELLKVINTLY